MTMGEVVEIYWATQDEEPSSASDIYLDFHKFDTIEFIIFADRLSSAVLVYRSACSQLEHMRQRFLQQKATGGHRVAGWEGESDIGLDENIGVVKESYTIAAGAATVTAVAALESLLIDLVPDDQAPPKGLHDLMEDFLNRHGHSLSRSQRKSLVGRELRVNQRRNQFAHALAGSYFGRSKASRQMFTDEALDENFRIVAYLAIKIEELYNNSQAR
ncbi:hypothetical protein ACFWDA_25770 [Rhodococcus zopfii]|uniref:hypothetical protein n=1 Tax=Rhodococcus zopfii TaxID=43772 RepID=UPI0036647B2E